MVYFLAETGMIEFASWCEKEEVPGVKPKKIISQGTTENCNPIQIAHEEEKERGQHQPKVHQTRSQTKKDSISRP